MGYCAWCLEGDLRPLGTCWQRVWEAGTRSGGQALKRRAVQARSPARFHRWPVLYVLGLAVAAAQRRRGHGAVPSAEHWGKRFTVLKARGWGLGLGLGLGITRRSSCAAPWPGPRALVQPE